MAGLANNRRVRRPVFIATYGGAAVPAPAAERAREPQPQSRPVSKRGLRHNFPIAGEEVEGGLSDGYCFRITFCGGRYAASYAMIVEFLKEQGYGDIPLPADVDELKAFRLPPRLRHQLSLFGEDGYVHNPIKILFPSAGGKRGALRLELYHEQAADHLLRFHNRK